MASRTKDGQFIHDLCLVRQVLADLDAVHTSQMLNIRRENVMSFSKTDYSGMMEDVSQSIRCYAESKAEGKTKKNIFDIFEKKDRRNS